MISSIKYVETQYIVIKVKLMSTGSSKSFGVPGESRTPNLLIRSQMLYPIELRAQTLKKKKSIKTFITQNGKIFKLNNFFLFILKL